MNAIVAITEYCIFTYFTICTMYLAIFSIASFFYIPITKRKDDRENNFAIIIPSYHEDNVIIDAINSALKQNYPKDKYEIYVVSDGMSTNTNNALSNKGVNVIEVSFKESSKAASLKYASGIITKHDYIIIIDADNEIPEQYLSKTNTFINATDCTAIQTHRQSKNMSNSISYIDTVIEEINNNIYRQGHNALGISSALIGSGMVFKYEWFIENIKFVNSTGEDKELEELLLKQQHYIYYAKDITLKDEKINTKSDIKRQRRRWLGTQINLLSIMYKNLLPAIKEMNVEYLLKIIETMALPKILLLGLLFTISVISIIASTALSTYWACMFIILLVALLISIPQRFWNKWLFKSLMQTPFLFLMMAINLFKIKGANKSFIHTKHGK